MDELTEALSRFITRDVVYILGGSIIMLSFLYMFSEFDKQLFQNLRVFLGPGNDWVTARLIVWSAGISWVLGYITQAFFSLIHIVRVRPPKTFGPIAKWFYYRFEERQWEEMGSCDLDAWIIKANESASEENKAELERLIALKQIGTAIGPCSFVSGLLLMLRTIVTGMPFDMVVTASILFLSMILIVDSRIKLMQQMQFTRKLASDTR